MNKKIFNILAWTAGITALFILIYRIYGSFTSNDILNNIQVIFNKNSRKYFLAALILMPANWMIESRKWQKTACLSEKIDYLTALKSVLTGLAFGHLLPGRSSEFFGKILFFSKENRNNITILHFINAAFQMYITVVAGLFFLFFYFNSSETEAYKQVIMSIGILIFILLSALLVYADKLYFLKKILPNLNYQMSHKLKFELILWSVLRYVIFILQFYCMFLVFNPLQELNVNFLAGTAVYFLITSVIPMISIIEVAIRALIGIIAFQGLSINDLQMTLITSIIWLINLAVPSLTGFLIFIFLKKNK